MPTVKPKPDGYHSVTAYLVCKNADAAIKWYAKAFGAKEIMRLPMPDGGIAHAEIQLGDSRVMLSDEIPQFGNKSAETFGGSPVAFMLYVEDVDSAFAKAIEAGATVKRAVQNQFYGDRTGTLVDPFGYQWSLGTHVEDVSEEEMTRRMAGMSAAPA
ncbi:MAG TPA: VOC family protein [Bryobacteraceae bacterium]|jgi:PhnB protein|nr:VOC family protein [Bryobacteraceae bacterium]